MKKHKSTIFFLSLLLTIQIVNAQQDSNELKTKTFLLRINKFNNSTCTKLNIRAKGNTSNGITFEYISN